MSLFGALFHVVSFCWGFLLLIVIIIYIICEQINPCSRSIMSRGTSSAGNRRISGAWRAPIFLLLVVLEPIFIGSQVSLDT